MTDPAVLRVIRFDERRWDVRVLFGIGLAALAVAGILLVTASPSDRDATSIELRLVLFACAAVLPALLFRRHLKATSIYVVLDEEGLIWGTDRTRDLSLPWAAISKIRAMADPFREGLMYSFAFQPVAGYVPAGRHTPRSLGDVDASDYLYAVDTRFGDCPADEFRALLQSRRPDLPILFGTFRDPV